MVQVKVAPMACFQRLGYILEEVLEEQEAADRVYDLLKRAGRLNLAGGKSTFTDTPKSEYTILYIV